MNIGKKIKDLRSEKLMTQSELAGTEITRNMLSQIENGIALPSLATVEYLAKRLGVPTGYLLSEGDEEFTYKKTDLMKNILLAYKRKNFELCREMCLTSFESFDDELELILTDCCLYTGEEYLKSGQLHKACNYLDEAISHSDRTMFSTVLQRNSICIMFSLLKEISPSLDSNVTDIIISEDLLYPSIYESVFCKYITVILDNNKYNMFVQEAEKHNLLAGDEDKLLLLHLRARQYMNKGDYKNAIVTLKQIIDSETVPQRFLLYLACSDMEICCKQVENYKDAYEFSQHKLEIFEHLLAEDNN